MKNSGISWTHNTWNPWVGCDKIAPECAHCYIGREVRKQTDWQKGGSPRKPWGEVYLTKTWEDPYKWQEELSRMDNDPTPRYPVMSCKRIFTCSLSDFFHAKVDKQTLGWNAHRMHTSVGKRISPENLFTAGWRACAWQVIKDTPNLVYLILTKRPELIPARLPKDWGEGYPNVWLGTSVGCRMTLNKIDSLRKVPVHPKAVRFLSCEPLLEDISENINLDGIGWVICGGESGDNTEYQWEATADWKKELHYAPGGRRTMDLLWAHRLRRRAWQWRIPFWFKQVTAGRSGKGEDALGEVVHEVPPPPYGQWVAMEKSNLVVIGRGETNHQPALLPTHSLAVNASCSPTFVRPGSTEIHPAAQGIASLDRRSSNLPDGCHSGRPKPQY